MSSFTKAVTEKQLEANRLNSLKSAGATSPEGKAIVSQNRVKHGFCGRFRVQPWENKEVYDSLVAALMEAEQPADASEVEVVTKMAEYTWLTRRALRLMDSCFNMPDPDDVETDLPEGDTPVGINPLSLETIMRYHVMVERSYQKAVKELMERRKQRQLLEIGFERKKLLEAQAKREEVKAQRQEAEAQHKAERHELAVAGDKFKNQILEVRAAKFFMAEYNRIQSPQPAHGQEFAVAEATAVA